MTPKSPMPNPAPPPLTRLKAEVQALKRRLVLEQARDMFFSSGYEATTLDAIADALQVTKPFLYTYFRTKSEILSAICEIGIGNSLLALEQALDSSLSPARTLRLIVEQVATIVLQNQKYIVVYEREEKNLELVDARRLLALRRRFTVLLSELLLEGNRQGEFDVTDTLLTAVAIGGLVTWIAGWYRPGGPWTQTEVIVQLVQSVNAMVQGRPEQQSAPRGTQRKRTINRSDRA